MNHCVKVFEASACDHTWRTKGVRVEPIGNGSVVLIISSFPSDDNALTHDDLSPVGLIFLNRKNAVSLAGEISMAVDQERPAMMIYEPVREMWMNDDSVGGV